MTTIRESIDLQAPIGDEVGAARRARPPAYDPKSTAGSVLRFGLEEGAAMVAANARAMAAAPGPDPLHQLRVGLRRARTILWAARRLTAPDEMRALGDQARDLGRIIAAPRALDVLRIDMLPKLEPAVMEAFGDVEPLRALEVRLDRARDKARRELTQPETFLSAATLSLDMINASRRSGAQDAEPALSKSARRWAAKALARAWRGVIAHDADFQGMTIEERHELRKDAKRLRYGLDAFRPLFAPEEIDPMRRAVRRLGNALGSLNDAADVELLKIYAPEKKYTPVNSVLLAAAEAEAEADAPKAASRWTVLRETSCFW